MTRASGRWLAVGASLTIARGLRPWSVGHPDRGRPRPEPGRRDGTWCYLGPRRGSGAAVQVSQLKVAWITPTHILWSFRVTGQAADLEALEFVVAASEQEVLSRSGSALQVSRNGRSGLGLLDDADLSSVDHTRAPSGTTASRLDSSVKHLKQA